VTTTTFTCDRCGQRIEAGRTLIRVETGPARDRIPEVDLCPGCLDALVAWLKAGAAPTSDRPRDKPPQANHGPRPGAIETADVESIRREEDAP
jgi:hypothetical protein